MRSTRAIIHLENLKQNIRNIKSFSRAETKMCVAVKADAYGHGAVPCARAAVEAGADFLAVANVNEGIELRQAGITASIIMLSLCTPEEIPEAVKFDIIPFVFDKEYVMLFDQAAEKLGRRNFPVHIAVDTGMGRIGCLENETAELARIISESKCLNIGGMGTHFAVSDSLAEPDVRYTQMQFQSFKRAVENVRKAGFNPGICHCSNSAAAIIYPEMQMDMVRSGITVYGYYAGDVTEAYLNSIGKHLNLEVVMTLETAVCSVRKFDEGKSVGYGRTWTSEKESDIGVLTIGYADGMLRNFSTSGVRVAVNGKEYPICGRICMDQCMIDVTGSDVKRWDKAVVFGCRKDGALQTAEEIAQKTGTISYEITSCITKRVERIFVD